MTDDSKWKRKLPGRIYDYNYKVSEAYYKPQTDFIDTRSYLPSAKTPPEHQTYAERFSNKPWYGKTRGLPYDEADAAIYQPLVNRRAASASRASSIMRDRAEHPDVPYDVRQVQRRRRREQELDDDEPIITKPMRKFNLEDGIDMPRKKIDVKEELRRLDEVKFSSTVPKKPSGRKVVSKEEVSYTLPPSGIRVHKSSYTETSKPPTGCRSRYTSFTSDDSKTSLPRTRKISLEESASSRVPPRPFIRRFSSSEESATTETTFRPKSKELRELQRSFESETLTDHIQKMVSKMRSHNIDPEEAYRYTKSIRASSLDPFGNDNKYQARHRAVRAQNFIYGVSNN